MEPFTEPPIGKKAKGLGSPFLSTRHFDKPFLAKDVLPVPGGPCKPKTAPFASPFIHCAKILSSCVLASL